MCIFVHIFVCIFIEMGWKFNDKEWHIDGIEISHIDNDINGI